MKPTHGQCDQYMAEGQPCSGYRRLEADLAAAQEEAQYRGFLVRDLLPYQERAVKAETELAAALENVKDYKENSALFLRQRDEARTELAAARALLRACLPELDGEGVTIHRVWAALAAPGEGK